MIHIEYKKKYQKSLSDLERLFSQKVEYLAGLDNTNRKTANLAKRLEIECKTLDKSLENITNYANALITDLENLVKQAGKEAELWRQNKHLQNKCNKMLPFYHAEIQNREALIRISEIENKKQNTGMTQEEIFLRETLEATGINYSEERINELLKLTYGQETKARRSIAIF